MYKRIAIIVSALICALIGTSCSNNSSSVNNIQYNSNEECTITISWWGGDERHEATENAIEVFENRYPNIHVKTDYGAWSGWKNKIFDELNNNTCSDIIQINYDWLVTQSYDGSGFYNLESLSDYIDLSNFSNDILEFGRRNGVLNAIPVSITGRSMFYNKSVYDKAGVDIPHTWEDLFTVAPKINDIGSYPINCVNNNTTCTAWYLCVVYEQQKTGKDFITSNGEIGFTIDEIADALQFYKDLQDNGVIRSTQLTKAQDTAENMYDCKTWQNGVIGGTLEWGSSVAKYQNALENPDDLVIGDLLTMENAKSIGWFYKPSVLFAINKDTQYPVQSAMLLDFLLNDSESAEILGTTRGIPVSSSALKVLEEKNMLSGLAYESNNQVVDKGLTVISPYMENSKMTEYYNQAIEEVSMEILSPYDAAQGIYANMIFTLEELKEGK